jgi:uncharacterized protein YdaU (DUF1376 family)
MRGTAAGFRIDAGSFLTDPRTVTFSAADLGGLVLLMSHAWVGGGEIPSDPDTLAALSRLGPLWASSRLAACIHLFFRIGVSRLVSIDLESQKRHMARVSETKAEAGRASGRRRRTPVEHMSNICSTGVQQVFGEYRSRDLEAQKGVQPSEQPVPATVPVKCSVIGPPETPLVASETDATDAHSGEFPLPPHTPLYRESSISSLSGDGGVGEEGEKTPIAVDLFGTPIPRPGRPKKRRPTPADIEAASLVVDAYILEVGPEESRTRQADQNVAKWIAEGASVEDLRMAIRNYARMCDRTNRDAHYRKAPHNFFGRQNAFWKSHVKEPSNDAPGNRQHGPVGRVRTGKSYEGISIAVSTAVDDSSTEPVQQVVEGAEHRENPFRTP